METIFEHNITKLELEKLSACSPYVKNRDSYQRFRDLDSINEDLYKLYTIRNQADKAESFLKKIRNIKNEGSVSFF